MEWLTDLESLEIHTGNIHVGGKAKVPNVSTAKDVSDLKYIDLKFTVTVTSLYNLKLRTSVRCLWVF